MNAVHLLLFILRSPLQTSPVRVALAFPLLLFLQLTTYAQSTEPPVSEMTFTGNLKIAARDVIKLNVAVFPNPYYDKLIFRFIAPITGQVKLEVYNVLGEQIGQVNYGKVDKGTQHTIEYHVPAVYRNVLLYRLNVGEHYRTGKVIPAKQ